MNLALSQAKLIISGLHHGQNYAAELTVLRAGNDLPRSSKLLNLSPFFNNDTETLRGVLGRLSRSQIHYDKKFHMYILIPILQFSSFVTIMKLLFIARAAHAQQLSIELLVSQRRKCLQKNHQKLRKMLSIQ